MVLLNKERKTGAGVALRAPSRTRFFASFSRIKLELGNGAVHPNPFDFESPNLARTGFGKRNADVELMLAHHRFIAGENLHFPDSERIGIPLCACPLEFFRLIDHKHKAGDSNPVASSC